VLETTVFEIRFQLSIDMSQQAFTLQLQLYNQSWVVFLHKLVVQRLLRSMAIVGGAINFRLIRRVRRLSVWLFRASPQDAATTEAPAEVMTEIRY
jgi:hypothetical protein